MRLVTDATLVAGSIWSGAQNHAYHLLDALSDQGDVSLLLRMRVNHENRRVNRLAHKDRVSRLNRTEDMGSLEQDIREFGGDVYFTLMQDLSAKTPCPAVTVIHDCGWFLHKERYPEGWADYYGGVLRHCVSCCSLVFAVSHTTKRDIVETLHIPEERVVVAPNAAVVDTSAGNKPPGFPDGPYFLMVNPGRAYKNWRTALHAFATVLALRPTAGLKLVLVGELWEETEAIAHEIAARRLVSHVILTGYVTDSELTFLYRNARLLLFPSLFEGFGIPILEAMAYDLPMALSDIPVFREVAGDAAIFFPAQDADRMAQTVIDLNEDETVRRRLISRGKERLRRYSWEKTASITLQALRLL